MKIIIQISIKNFLDLGTIEPSLQAQKDHKIKFLLKDVPDEFKKIRQQ